MSFGSASRCGALAILVAALVGCNTVPKGRSAVDAVSIRGADAIDSGEVEDRIATTETTKFLGLFRGVVFEYSIFDRFVLQRDLARVEAFYRSKGFFDAHARAGRVYTVDDRHVRVEIVVEEGEPVLVRDVRVVGLDGLPPDLAETVRRAARDALPQDARFEEEKFTSGEGAVRRALTDRGYAYAKVERDAAVDIVVKRADVVYEVTPGKPAVFGEVTIEGLGNLPEKNVRRTIDIDPGEPYSEQTLDSAQQALLDLGVFASVELTPDLERGDGVVPVHVKVEPSRLRNVRLGGGIELDALKSDVHGLAGWEDRNFLGGLRTFSVLFRPGVVLYPLRINNIEFPTKLLPEARLRLELRQPGFLEARTNAFLRPEIDVQPLLLDPNPPPEQRVIGYVESRNGVGLDRTFWKLYAAISHNLQIAYPFAYVGERDPTLGTVVISYPALLTVFDFRDDRIQPRKGVLVGNMLEVAGGPFGGNAADVKVQPELRGYVPLSRRVVFAARASVGFLFARNYGTAVQSPTPLAPPSEERTRDYQLTFFRGFFSGGPTSNRGYPLRGVGPHDIVPFISPDVEIQRLSSFCAENAADCRTPTGGFTLWEGSMELRFSLDGPLSLATFCDASDVSPREANLRFNHLHLSCGGGVRYDTPVGPIRLDVGYRIPGMQVLGERSTEEREPQTFPFGIPIALHFGIGEAY